MERDPRPDPLAPRAGPLPRADDGGYGGPGTPAAPYVPNAATVPSADAGPARPPRRGRSPLPVPLGMALFAVLLVLVSMTVKQVRLRRAGERRAARHWERVDARRDAAAAARSPTAAPASPGRPAGTAPQTASALRVPIEGRGATVAAADAQSRLPATLAGLEVRFVSVPAGGAPRRAVPTFRLRLLEDGVEAFPGRGVVPADDVEVAPETLAASLATDGVFPASPAARGPVVAGVAALAAGAPEAAEAALARAPAGAGVSALRAVAALGRRDLRAAHAHAEAASKDPATARLARTVVGAALLLDGSPAEAMRDLDAAAAAAPPAGALLRLRARAQERLALWDLATASYDRLAAADPDDATAAAGRAALRARGDASARAAAVEGLRRFVAARPDATAAWRAIGALERGGDEARLAVAADAFRRVAAARPRDAAAWDALGGVLAALARARGGEAPWLEAAAAYARETELAPASGDAWFNRAASLHEAALARPLGAEAAGFASRWGEAREAYARALATGVAGEPAARVLFNLGLLLEVAPPGARPVAGTPPSPRRAFEAALEADPERPGARAALLGAIVAEGDVPAARDALARLPAQVEPTERTVLEASVLWIAGDADGARAALARPGPPPREALDPLPPLARALLERDYRRTALALLLPEASDPARVHLRARARAELRDPEGLAADLALLDRLDPRLAADVRARDVSIRRALGL